MHIGAQKQISVFTLVRVGSMIFIFYNFCIFYSDMKRLFSFCCCILLVLNFAAFAATSHQGERPLHYVLLVGFSDGTEATFDVSDDLSISFNDNVFTIVSASACRTVDVSDVCSLRYIDSNSGITNPLADACLSIEGNSLIINLQEAASLDVYSAEGLLLTSDRPLTSHIISLDGLHGVIIVKCGAYFIKFFVR